MTSEGWGGGLGGAQQIPALRVVHTMLQHLDLEACVWLEETLKNYPSVLLLVSHSQDFLNGVCNSIIFMGKKQLTYYGGAQYCVHYYSISFLIVGAPNSLVVLFSLLKYQFDQKVGQY